MYVICEQIDLNQKFIIRIYNWGLWLRVISYKWATIFILPVEKKIISKCTLSLAQPNHLSSCGFFFFLIIFILIFSLCFPYLIHVRSFHLIMIEIYWMCRKKRQSDDKWMKWELIVSMHKFSLVSTWSLMPR